MRNATREAQVAQPIFELSDFFKVTFKRVETNSSIGRQSATNRLQSATTTNNDIVENIVDSIVENNITEVQKAIVTLMNDNPKINIKLPAETVGIAPRNVQVHIKTLKNLGIIKRVGPAKGGHWVVLDS